MKSMSPRNRNFLRKSQSCCFRAQRTGSESSPLSNSIWLLVMTKCPVTFKGLSLLESLAFISKSTFCLSPYFWQTMIAYLHEPGFFARHVWLNSLSASDDLVNCNAVHFRIWIWWQSNVIKFCELTSLSTICCWQWQWQRWWRLCVWLHSFADCFNSEKGELPARLSDLSLFTVWFNQCC